MSPVVILRSARPSDRVPAGMTPPAMEPSTERLGGDRASVVLSTVHWEKQRLIGPKVPMTVRNHFAKPPAGKPHHESPKRDSMPNDPSSL